MTKENDQCGIIMPISAIDGCHETHWSDVLAILKEVIDNAGLKGDVVSYADEVGIIQKRIIDNLYHNLIVICDVSCKNPNVMFELGMRLAFDKPTIIIKDDCTSYSFDTSPIEHLEYPRDLNYVKINSFKERLAVKIKAQLDAVNKNGAYSPFLKNFGEFTVPKLDQKEVSGQGYIIEQLNEINKKIDQLETRLSVKNLSQRKVIKQNDNYLEEPIYAYNLGNCSEQKVQEIVNKLQNIDMVKEVNFVEDEGQLIIKFKPSQADKLYNITEELKEILKNYIY